MKKANTKRALSKDNSSVMKTPRKTLGLPSPNMRAKNNITQQYLPSQVDPINLTSSFELKGTLLKSIVRPKLQPISLLHATNNLDGMKILDENT